MRRPVAAALLAVLVSCQNPDPRKAVALGRGPVSDTSTISVTRVSVAASAVNYSGHDVQAGPGHRYVVVDCRIAAPVDSVDFDDFQLVRDRAQLGHETNVGDHGDSDYFYWSYLDASGRPVTQPPTTAGPFLARLAFKVPADATRGYLFYWGLYWGPFDFR